jgi:hypothetical protein
MVLSFIGKDFRVVAHWQAFFGRKILSGSLYHNFGASIFLLFGVLV